jgi:hypothetical protein
VLVDEVTLIIRRAKLLLDKGVWPTFHRLAEDLVYDEDHLRKKALKQYGLRHKDIVREAQALRLVEEEQRKDHRD